MPTGLAIDLLGDLDLFIVTVEMFPVAQVVE